MTDKLYVPIKRVSLPEVTSSVDLTDALARVYDQGLPGFVIRSSGLQDTGDSSHERIAHRIAEALPAATGQYDSIFGRRTGFKFSGYTGIADLHHDVMHTVKPPLRLHTTTEGSGHVTLANAGRLVAEHYLSSSRHSFPKELNEDDLDNVDHKLLRAQANPDIINPHVYTAFLDTGDNLVFPVGLPESSSHNKAGPIWHRFDTSSDHQRSAIVSEIFKL